MQCAMTVLPFIRFRGGGVVPKRDSILSLFSRPGHVAAAMGAALCSSRDAGHGRHCNGCLLLGRRCHGCLLPWPEPRVYKCCNRHLKKLQPHLRKASTIDRESFKRHCPTRESCNHLTEKFQSLDRESFNHGTAQPIFFLQPLTDKLQP